VAPRAATTVGELPGFSVSLDVREPGRAAGARFHEQRSLPGVLLSENGRFRVVLSRRAFLDSVGRNFGVEVFHRRPLSFLLGWLKDTQSTLIFAGDTPIDVVVQRGLERPRPDIYEPIVVTTDGRGGGPIGEAVLVDFEEVLLAASALAARRAEELRRAEEHLAESQKLEAVGQLAGGIAHDFNNLLAVILGYGELLQKDTAASELSSASLQAILEAARRAADLTRQLLTFSRREEHRPRVCNLNGIVLGVRSMVEGLLRERIELVLELADDIEDAVLDRNRIEQAILNLAINGRDAMHAVGTLTIGTRNEALAVPISGVREFIGAGSYVVLRVADTGRGIDKETLDRIFEPFFTTKPAGQGTGLGLTTVRSIVQQSAGFVRVESSPGSGSVFELYFPSVPRRIEVESAAEGARSAPPSGRGESVLVVDDQPLVRRFAGEALRHLGYNPVLASTPQHAIAAVEGGAVPIDAVLTDVLMPAMDGRELAERLARARPGIKVVYMSGFTPEALEGSEPSRRLEPLLAKPVSLDTLARALRAVFD
jgi:signal transduction histidine kinase